MSREPESGSERFREQKPLGKVLLDFFSSFGLAAAVFFLMAVITLFGTLEQVDVGIHDTQAKWFTSFIVVHEIGGKVPFIFPGGYLLMAILFVNLCIGTVRRFGWVHTLGALVVTLGFMLIAPMVVDRMGTTRGYITLIVMLCVVMVIANQLYRKATVILSHLSMILLLAGAAVTHHLAIDGAMKVYEGGESNYFQDFHKWDVAIEQWRGDAVPETAAVLPWEKIKVLSGTSRRVFHGAELPFEIEISNFVRNAYPGYSRAGSPDADKEANVYDGFYLREAEVAYEAERNLPGLEARIVKDGKTMKEGILWGMAREPLAVDLGDGSVWAIKLQKRLYQTPFTIALDKFTHDKHAGTEMAKRFVSDVRKIQDGIEEPVIIKMNHPLREQGYAVFQQSFGDDERTSDGKGVYSVFAIWDNPADHWPLYACILVGVSLLFYFGGKLLAWLKRIFRRREAKTKAPGGEVVSSDEGPVERTPAAGEAGEPAAP